MVDLLKLADERKKRYLAAMNLEKPDKVPIRLTMSGEFIAKVAGYTFQEIYYDWDKNIDATKKMLAKFDELDVIRGAANLWWASLHDAVGAKYLQFAGLALEENTQFQYVEDEYMLAEDYDDFIANPTEWLATKYLPRIHTELSEPGSYRATVALIKGAFGLANQFGYSGQAWAAYKEEYGAVPSSSGISKAPFDTLADTLRGLHGIMLDLYQRPDKLKEALEVVVPHNIFYGMATSRGDTDFPVFMPLHRGAYPFLNKRQWEEFYWPTLKQVIEALWSKGKRTLFYAENNWTPYLEKIAELPEKSIVFHVDTTDMEKSHKILGGRFCLSGNVPNTLLAFGKPDEVKDYVKRLLDKYARDGGFIIDAGAVILADASEKNMHALVEAAREYGVY
jgi:uroporphyrinogen-III decarboxylase